MNIETKHLILKPPTVNSLNEASKLWEDNKVRKFLGGTISRESIQEKTAALQAHWDQYKFGLYVVFLKDISKIIGLCGLHHSEFESDIELSYMFFHEFWGKGLATEAVLVCLEEGFKKFKLKRIIAITQKANIASCRLLEKAGMHLAQEFKRFNAEQRMYEKWCFKKISFIPLSISHLSLIYKWFNKPHVQEFYSLRNWTLNEVEKKLLPYINQEKPVYPYVVYLDQEPIAYIQYYRVMDYPWPKQEISEEIMMQSAGFDFFIGEEEYIGKGIGRMIVEVFLNELIWPNFSYCMVDPDIRNERSLNFFEKCGFKFHRIIDTEDALRKKVQLQLMIRSV